MPYNVLIKIYLDNVLLSLIPLWNVGVATDEGVAPQGEDSLIRYAKDNLRRQNRHTDAEIDGCIFVVERYILQNGSDRYAAPVASVGITKRPGAPS